jgi:hypothetical protein
MNPCGQLQALPRPPLALASEVASSKGVRASDLLHSARRKPVFPQVSIALRLAGLKVRCSTIELTPRDARWWRTSSPEAYRLSVSGADRTPPGARVAAHQSH